MMMIIAELIGIIKLVTYDLILNDNEYIFLDMKIFLQLNENSYGK